MIDVLEDLEELREMIDRALDFGKSDFMDKAEKEIYWATLKQIDERLFFMVRKLEELADE